MRRSLPALRLLAAVLLGSCLSPALAQPVIGYQSVITGLTQPVDLVHAGDGSNRMFIVQQNGIVRVWNGTALLSGNFLDVSAQITPNGEQGLLSMAFHPGFNGTSNRYFFIYYTALNGDVTLARYQTQVGNSNLADASSGVVLLSIPKPGNPYFTNHNGGKIIFGLDGMLYFGTGDGGNGGDPFNNAQDPSSLRGKMLRIDVNGFATSAPFYAIPSDNPYTSSTDGIRDEIWAVGLRNPWRWSFDRANGDMWIADVGQGAWEEVNRVAAGASGINYGWRCREGSQPYDQSLCNGVVSTPPIFEYGHNSTGGYSITGGFVYRGTAYPALRGYYVTADYVTGNAWMVRANGSFVRQSGLPTTISSFGESENGELYAARRSNGTVYQVTVTATLPVTLSAFSAERQPSGSLLRWTTAGEWNTEGFELQYGSDGRQFSAAGWVAAARAQNGQQYSFQHPGSFTGDRYYRLAIRDDDGSVRYSSVVRLSARGGATRIYPSVVRDGLLTLERSGGAGRLQLVNGSGALVFEQALGAAAGTSVVRLPSLSKGVYLVRVVEAEGTVQQKIFIE